MVKLTKKDYGSAEHFLQIFMKSLRLSDEQFNATC